METLIKYAPPIILHGAVQQWLFLLLPAVGAMLGAFIGRGSFLRIVGASAGAASRDFGIILLVSNGLLTPTNPHWHTSIAFILAYLCASGAAIMSCLAPYRGTMLLLNSAIGGFAGQFFLTYILAIHRHRDRDDETVIAP